MEEKMETTLKCDTYIIGVLQGFNRDIKGI